MTTLNRLLHDDDDGDGDDDGGRGGINLTHAKKETNERKKNAQETNLENVFNLVIKKKKKS